MENRGKGVESCGKLWKTKRPATFRDRPFALLVPPFPLFSVSAFQHFFSAFSFQLFSFPFQHFSISLLHLGDGESVSRLDKPQLLFKHSTEVA